MSRQFAGVTDFTEQPSKRRDTISGSFVVRTWKGAESKLDDFLATGLPAGWTQREIEVGFDYVTVSANYGVNPEDNSTTPVVIDPLSRIWTLQGVDEQIPLRDLSKVVSALNQPSLDEDGRVAFWKEFDEEKRRGTPPSELDNPLFEDGFQDGVLRQLYIREVSGQTNMIYHRWTLSKNQTVTSLSAIRASHANVGRLYRWESLLASEPTLASEAPLLDLGVLNATKTLYWRKLPSNVTPASAGQWGLTQSYESFEEFDRWVYEDEI